MAVETGLTARCYSCAGMLPRGYFVGADGMVYGAPPARLPSGPPGSSSVVLLMIYSDVFVSFVLVVDDIC